MTRVRTEDLVGAHVSDGGHYAGTHEVEHLPAPEDIESGYDDQPYQQAAEADDPGVLEADDIAQAEHCGAGVEFEHHLGLVCYHVADVSEGSADGFRPRSERGDGEVIQTADKACQRQRFGTLAAAFTAHQHLGRGRGFREGILAVHLAHEILAEGDEEEYAQHASEQAAEEHLHEAYVQPEDIDCRQGEDGSGHDYAAAGSYALDNHVLPQGVLLAQRSADAHRQDGNRDGRFEHLANLEAQVCGCGTEQHGHQKTHPDTVQGYFFRLAVGRHQGFILFPFFQGTMCVFGQFHGLQY